MKENKCPYCSAPVQENAAFCLHCMMPLDNKTVIRKKRSKKPLIWLLLILLVLLVAGTICLFMLPSGASEATLSEDFRVSSGASSESDAVLPAVVSDTDSTASDTNRTTVTSRPSGTVSQGQTPAPGVSGSSSKTSSAGSSSKTSAAGSSSRPAEPVVHTHSYQVETTTAPTCGHDGSKTYRCSCGDHYTVTLPATGEHHWVALKKTVHHEATGHYENKIVAAGYSWYKCAECSATFPTVADYYAHFDSVHVPQDPLIRYIRENYTHGTVPAQYETVWVVDQAAYDETVITGYQCSVCGKKK